MPGDGECRSLSITCSLEVTLLGEELPQGREFPLHIPIGSVAICCPASQAQLGPLIAAGAGRLWRSLPQPRRKGSHSAMGSPPQKAKGKNSINAESAGPDWGQPGRALLQEEARSNAASEVCRPPAGDVNPFLLLY